MDALIATSTNGFNTAFTGSLGMTGLGLTVSSTITFMKTWLTYTIGAGFGLLQALMPYIIGLIVIGSIVYFLFRAFRFFKH